MTDANQTPDGCGAPAGGVPVAAATGAGSQAIVEGHVRRDDAPVSIGYARLLAPVTNSWPRSRSVRTAVSASSPRPARGSCWYSRPGERAPTAASPPNTAGSPRLR